MSKIDVSGDNKNKELEMKRLVLALLFTLVAVVVHAEIGKMITEPQGLNRVPVFAPDIAYDYLVTPVVTAIPVSGFVAASITSSTDCKYWKSATNVRGAMIPVAISSGSAYVRGVNKSTKFFIYSGCTGASERQ